MDIDLTKLKTLNSEKFKNMEELKTIKLGGSQDYDEFNLEEDETKENQSDSDDSEKNVHDNSDEDEESVSEYDDPKDEDYIQVEDEDEDESKLHMNTSWIDSFYKHNELYKDAITHIKMIIYYINNEGNIFNIHKEMVLLNENSILTQEKIVYFLKHYSMYMNKSYKLKYILKYNPSYDCDEIINNLNSKTNLYNIEVNKSKYLEEVHSLNDIKWEDSVDIFKD